MWLALVVLLAWMLSVLAPCVLPVLPVILGWSLSSKERYKPLIVVGSTVLSIVLFTIILKASTALLGIDPSVWTWISGLIIILYGVILLRPEGRDRFRHSLWLDRANHLAQASTRYHGVWGDVVLGASLGPIFASCSPTYALLLGVVFPQSFALGVTYTLIYGLGFGALLLLIAYGGRAVISRLQWVTDPRGRFKRWLWLLLVITWVLVVTGLMKDIEIAVLDAGWGDVTLIEEKLLDQVDSVRE